MVGAADETPVTQSSPLEPLRVMETWPQGLSHRASLRISDVLSSLRVEFPTVSHSKLRFLEEQGLVTPSRTSSGYRQYSPADVERLRFVLTQQRDRYLPLKVIKERLADLDAGGESPDHVVGPRLATADGHTTAQHAVTHLGSLADVTGASHAFIEELASANLLETGAQGSPSATDHNRLIVQLAGQLQQYGIDWRHLRSIKSAASRHVALVEQVAAGVRARPASSAPAEAAVLAGELGEVIASLHTAWLRAELRKNH
ncbi:MerR family transcriptional regulator [Jonesia quinghaiensis]|uniref:transcriptional regulator FtsR n=1 Tax=Jonesia quinghaiensis TaxID=262806 RepID=UPI0004207477|nr:MerR family transcriptional regulator [Jonesia quinghaiensis]